MRPFSITIAAVGDAQACAGVLFDQQQAEAGLAHMRQGREQFAHRSGERDRARVRRAAARRAPTSAPGRSRASAARRRSWCVRSALSARAGGETVPAPARDCAASPLRARCAIGAEQQVLPHRQIAEDAAAFRHQREARLDDLVRRRGREVAAAKRHRCRRARCGTMPAMAFSSELLPAPLAPRMTTISPRADGQRDVGRARDAGRKRRDRWATSSIRRLPR